MKLLLLVMAVLSVGCIGGLKEKFAIVEELPQAEEWEGDHGEHLDFGVVYAQIWVVWIPVWNMYPEYALSPKRNRNKFYYEINEENISKLGWDAEYLNTLKSSSGSPSSWIPFWDAYGWKLVIVAGGFVFLQFAKVMDHFSPPRGSGAEREVSKKEKRRREDILWQEKRKSEENEP